jgi:enoyl-CoA hydratase/carnithine racemase
MADQDAGQQAKELVEATKTLSAAQAEIAGLLRHVVQKALPATDTLFRWADLNLDHE